ncbi:MAG: PKD domain-containing protein [Bacteroidales bacterium]|nr:PKD domain-containing protein [Bacteroidales bacterium]
MKKILLVFLCVIISVFVISQERAKDAYYTEETGYYMNVKPALNGFVFTDNYCNSLYYLNNGNLETLISAPGCGRYFSISVDGTKVGFKLISKNGQTPAYYDLKTKQIVELDEETNLCGQLGFTANSVYYTKGEWLHAVINQNESEEPGTLKVKLGSYSNIVSVSEDYSNIVYSTPNDELVLLTIDNFEKTIISEPGKMSVYPQFSPDGEKILYQSGEIYVYEIATGKTHNLGHGLAPKWSPDSKTIVYTKQKVEENTLTGSDLFICDYQSAIELQVTNTTDVHEMQPEFLNETEIVFNTYNSRKICKLNITNNKIVEIYEFSDSPEIQFFNLNTTKSEDMIPGTVPYTHQVYDTPDNHYGYGSCAPTCAIMAISYYNIVPKWPTAVEKLYPHNSDYGSYVSLRYRLNEHYFEDSDQPSSLDLAYGGYGYMWGLGSPNSQMRNYMELHYMESSQLWNSSVTWESVINEIDADYPLPMCAMLSSAGHLILTKGYIHDQHTLIFSEPYGDKNTPSWPSYDGHKAYYDWPGYNNGYQNLDYNGTYGVIAWTVTAHASEVEYNNLIIDDVYYNHGFVINNSEDGSTQRYYRDINGGYNNHFWYTITEAGSNNICWVKWIPTPESEGYYEISAYIPGEYADAENAPYKIFDADGEHTQLINQGDYSEQWVSLGVYRFESESDFYVYIGDATGTDGQNIAFDAMKFDYIPTPIASFSTASQDFCVGETITFTNTSEHANNYEWAFPGATSMSSTDENPQITYSNPGTYDVSLTAYGSVENDIVTNSSYITIHTPPTANFAVNTNNVFLPQATVIFSNFSENANSYLWNFDDGSSSSDTNPYHIYSQEGNYTVSLTAGNDWCADDVYILDEEIIVLNPTKSSEVEQESLTIFPNPATNKLNLFSKNEILEIKIYNNLGQLVLQKQQDNNIVEISSLLQGEYIIEIWTKKDCFYKYFTKI